MSGKVNVECVVDPASGRAIQDATEAALSSAWIDNELPDIHERTWTRLCNDVSKRLIGHVRDAINIQRR